MTRLLEAAAVAIAFLGCVALLSLTPALLVLLLLRLLGVDVERAHVFGSVYLAILLGVVLTRRPGRVPGLER